MSDNAIPRNPLIEHSFINFSSPQFQKKALIALAVTSLVMIVVGSMGLGGVGFLAALAIPMAIHFIAVIGGAGAFTLSFVGIRKLFHQDKNKNLEIDQKLQAATPQDKTQNLEIEIKLQADTPQVVRIDVLLLEKLFPQNFKDTINDLNKTYSPDLEIDRNLKNQLNEIESEKIKNMLHLELWKFKKIQAYLNYIERTSSALLKTDLQNAFKFDPGFNEVRKNKEFTSENIKTTLETLHSKVTAINKNIQKEEGFIKGNLKLMIGKLHTLSEKEIEKTLQETIGNSNKERKELNLSNIEYVFFKEKDFLPILDAFTQKFKNRKIKKGHP